MTELAWRLVGMRTMTEHSVRTEDGQDTVLLALFVDVRCVQMPAGLGECIDQLSLSMLVRPWARQREDADRVQLIYSGTEWGTLAEAETELDEAVEGMRPMHQVNRLPPLYADGTESGDTCGSQLGLL